MSRPARQAASNVTPPSVPSRAVDVARGAHEREGARATGFQNPAGPHKAQEGRLLRPRSSSRGRHSTESAPPAFENRTPHSHPRVVFSEAEEPQGDLDRRPGKGRADNAGRPYQEYVINKLWPPDPKASPHPWQGTRHTPPTNVVHLDTPPSRWLQNHPRPSPPTKSQHLHDPSTSRPKPTKAPRRRGHSPSRNRKHRAKLRPELFVPLDPYRLTISPIGPAKSFFKQMGDWAMQGLPNREGRAPDGAGNELEEGLRPRPTEAPVRAETAQLQEQLRGRRIPVLGGRLSDGATHLPAVSASLPNLPEVQLPRHNTTLYPPGQSPYNPEEGPPSRPPTPENTRSRPLSKASGKGDSERKRLNGDNKVALDHSPPEASTSPKPASEPAPHHTPLLSRISPLHLPSGIPGISHPDGAKPIHPSPSYWEQIIRQMYRHLLLRLPSLYFNRVGRVFQEARISKPDLELLISRATVTQAAFIGGAIASALGGANIIAAQGGEEGKRWVSDVLDGITGTPRRPFGTPRHPSEREGLFDADHSWASPELGLSPSPKFTVLGLHGHEASQATLADAIPPGEQWTVPHVSWSLERFKEEWENFVIGLIKEWKTLNILSALLLTALFTVFQIEEAAQNAVTRTMALLSLISALMSLIFGCVYILRFSTMRTMRKAAKWAEEAQKSTSDIFWNVWVFLALPACWLAWSVILFCFTVVSFIWTTGNGGTQAASDPTSLTASGLTQTSGAVLGPRILETLFFALGIVYFVLVIRTFWVWSSVGSIPLRVGGEHVDDHHLKEDHATALLSAPLMHGVLGGTGKLGVVPETKEGGSGKLPSLSDQYTDTDEKHHGRSPGKKDAALVEVVLSKGDTASEKGRGRWWGRFSSENLAEGAEKMAYVSALDRPVEAELESRRTPEGSSDRDVPLHAGASSTPASVLGVSLHG